MIINGSSDITFLSVKVTFDISLANPVISLENLSQGNNLAGCSFAFSAYSPSKSPIHIGDITSPDVVGAWSTFSILDQWPSNPFNPNQIEWSGLPYIFFVTVKDSAGNVFTTQNIEPQFANICPPADVTEHHKSYFGIASSNVTTACDKGSVFFQDTTNTEYKGLPGTKVSSTLTVGYPLDGTGSRRSNFNLITYSSALVPVYLNSPNYDFVQNSVYDYDTGNNVHIRVRYQLNGVFGVWCGVDLLPLNVILRKYFDKIQNNEFSDMASAQKRSLIILAEYSLIVSGIVQPLSGAKDIPYHIRKIEELSGFKCFDECCGAASGIIPQSSSLSGDTNYIVNSTGGDVSGSVTVEGSNITFNIGDVKYIVDVTENSPSDTTSVTVVPELTGDGHTKYYHIQVDARQLADDLATVIGNDAYELNKWKQLLVDTNNGTFNLLVDGGCVFASNASCNYVFRLSNIPIDTTYAILTGINVNGINHSLSYSFNITNLAGLQSYLNALNYGVFVVTNLGTGSISIETDGNTNSFVSLSYKTAGASYLADYSKTCTGYVPKSANEVIQLMINYICNLDDSQVATSQDYVITYVDNTGVKRTETVNGRSELTFFITELLSKIGTTIQYITSLSALTCANTQALFPENQKLIQVSDFILGAKGGDCAKFYPVELGTRQLQLGAYDPDFMAAFCNALNLCSAGLVCELYNIFNVSVVEHSPLDDTFDIIVTFNHPSAVANSLRYARVDNTTSPVFSSPITVWPTDSPYTIKNVPQGKYDIGLTPVYSDGRNCSELYVVTGDCTGIVSFSVVYNTVTGNFDITYVLAAGLPAFKVNITYPNGGGFYRIYNAGDTVSIAPPAGVSGAYSVTLTPVCDVATGWYGAATAPAVVNISATPCCAAGYTLSSDETYCYKIDQVAATPSGGSPILNAAHFTSTAYGIYGVVFYKSGGYNVDGTWPLGTPSLLPDIYTPNSALIYPNANVIPYSTNGIWLNATPDTSHGRLNTTGLWLQGNQSYIGVLGFARQINIPTEGDYYIGVGSDDFGTIKIDGVIVVSQNISNMSGANYFNTSANDCGFRFWHMYPVHLTAGYHIFELDVDNTASIGVLGFEIYTGNEAALIALTSLDSGNLLFSSKDVVNGEAFDIGNYYCTDPTYQLVNDGGTFYCRKIETQATVPC